MNTWIFWDMMFDGRTSSSWWDYPEGLRLLDQLNPALLSSLLSVHPEFSECFLPCRLTHISQSVPLLFDFQHSAVLSDVSVLHLLNLHPFFKKPSNSLHDLKILLITSISRPTDGVSMRSLALYQTDATSLCCLYCSINHAASQWPWASAWDCWVECFLKWMDGH